MNEWISVDDRLPKTNSVKPYLSSDYVLVTDGTEVFMGCCFPDTTWDIVDHYEIFHATHWMPLPEPPNN